MENEDETLHFTLHLDKALQCLVVMACWNPAKDLLAMVSSDHQLTAHRLNWQKLWAITPEKRITSICWRPDGKALAAGYGDGKISLHDVENGEVIRIIETHNASIQCLHWVETLELPERSYCSDIYENRTNRFFPPLSKMPTMPGMGSAFDMVGALGTGDYQERSQQTTSSKTSEERLSILCSGDSEGIICLNAFGLFPIAKLDIRKSTGLPQLSPVDIVLSSNFRNMTVVCRGHDELFAVSVDTSLLNKRHKNICKAALQASDVEKLLDTIRASLAVMRKHWFDAIDVFFEKFGILGQMLKDNGSEMEAYQEFQRLLACGTASTSLQQFLAVTLGEPGLKRLSKSIESAGKELIDVIEQHLHLAAERTVFGIGELMGYSRYTSQARPIGLDKALVEDALEHAKMLFVQVERFLIIVGNTNGQFRNFFYWLTKALRQVNGESMPLENINSDSIASFLTSQFKEDPVGPHLKPEAIRLKISEEELEHARNLALLGGFKDIYFKERTLYWEFDLLRASCRSAFSRPVAVISPCLVFKRQLALPDALPTISLAFYEIKQSESPGKNFVDYTCFTSHADRSNYVGILRGFSSQEVCEVAALQLEGETKCVDASFYKEKQLILLLKDSSSGQATIMALPLDGISFASLDCGVEGLDLIEFCLKNKAVGSLKFRDGKSRYISQLDVIPPLAVSPSRGLACVFAAQRRALLYDLEEDESPKDEAI